MQQTALIIIFSYSTLINCTKPLWGNIQHQRRNRYEKASNEIHHLVHFIDKHYIAREITQLSKSRINKKRKLQQMKAMCYDKEEFYKGRRYNDRNVK